MKLLPILLILTACATANRYGDLPGDKAVAAEIERINSTDFPPPKGERP